MTDATAPAQNLLFPDEAREFRDRALWAGVLVLLLLVAYSPAIQADFIWDDPRHVTENRVLRTPR